MLPPSFNEKLSSKVSRNYQLKRPIMRTRPCQGPTSLSWKECSENVNELWQQQARFPILKFVMLNIRRLIIVIKGLFSRACACFLQITEEMPQFKRQFWLKFLNIARLNAISHHAVAHLDLKVKSISFNSSWMKRSGFQKPFCKFLYEFPLS